MTDTTDLITAIAQRRAQSLSSMVVSALEKMILTGELKGGERLNEQALASQLGVSRGPIREATRALEQAGLVTAIVNHGVFVRQISPEEASELYDVRTVVFGLLCQQLAERITPDQERMLRSLIADMDKAARAADLDTYYTLNLQFDGAIIRFAGHARGKSTYESLVKELHLFRQRGLNSPESMAKSNREHKAIVDAIAAGDGASARECAEAHVANAKQRWQALMD